MSLPAKESVLITDFPGLVNNADKRDLPPGVAEEQTNAQSRTRGELTIRRGVREVTFEN